MDRCCDGRKGLVKGSSLTGFCLLILLSLCLAACSEAVPARRTIAPAENKLGVHLLLDDGRSHWPAERWRAHMTAASRLVGAGGYVTQLVRLDDLDPEKWPIFMDLGAELDLVPIIRLATAPNGSILGVQMQWELQRSC